MGKYVDLTGKTFGRLTCINMVGRDSQRRALWLCKCACGNETTVVSTSLTGRKTKSCGCLHKDLTRERTTTHSLSIDANGKTPRLYSIWRNMKQRCNNPNAAKFEKYGGRGIKVCEEWMDYMNFHNWAIANGYADGLTLDRKDNNSNYQPSNCRWVSVAQQNLNKSNQRLITFNGETRTILEWSNLLGMKYSTLKCRLDDYGWAIEKAFKTPVRRRSS
jgi:hypothetical protein